MTRAHPGQAATWIPYSGITGLAWPALPPTAGQAVLATQLQFELSQWLSFETIRARQYGQLRRLVRFAIEQVPHYRDHLAATGLSGVEAIDHENFLHWPVLAKSAVQQDGNRFLSRNLPEGHAGVHWTTTSGSTGQPLRAANSGSGIFFQHALLLRSQIWYGLDPREKFAIIRATTPTAVNADWGMPANMAFRTGPSVTMSAFEDHRDQLRWLRREAPAYLLAHNTNLRALLGTSVRDELIPASIRVVIGFADMAAPDTTELAHEHWHASYFQTYSCSEVGTMALQCPLREHLHVQSEHVLLEILRPDGSPCVPGEVGRVVVTDLHNFAMPLIRYELGDQAAFGAPCACGRGLPVLQEIAGRTSDLAIDPTGRSFFAHMNLGFWATAAPILQRQIVQTAADHLEIRFVAQRDLTADECAQLVAEVRSAMRYDYRVTLTRVARIALGPGGKFSDFVSLIGRTVSAVPPHGP